MGIVLRRRILAPVLYVLYVLHQPQKREETGHQGSRLAFWLVEKPERATAGEARGIQGSALASSRRGRRPLCSRARREIPGLSQTMLTTCGLGGKSTARCRRHSKEARMRPARAGQTGSEEHEGREGVLFFILKPRLSARERADQEMRRYDEL